jgi:hypothetical protein
MKFKATSDSKRVLQVNWNLINVYVSRYKPNTTFDIEITRRQKLKSDPMRKYYFSTVLPPYMEELGYEKDEDELFHRQLKIVYFRIKPDTKGIHRHVPSVFGNKSKIPVPEKKKFVEWVVRKAAQDGVYVPDPNE